MRVRPRLVLPVSAFLVAVLPTVLLTGCGAPAAQAPTGSVTTTSTAGASGRTSVPAYFVTAAHVHANLAHSIVIDARPAKDYAAGHIPGAINAPWQLFANMHRGKPGDKGRATLKSASGIAKVLGGLGIDRSKQVVVYAAPGGWGEDGRVAWMLRMAGFPNSMVLDGGYGAWVAAGYEAATQKSVLAPTVVSITSLDPGLVIRTTAVAAGLGTFKIIDARTPGEYAGSTDLGEPRGGHLPGAANVPFESMFTAAGILKTPGELQALFEAAGVAPSDEIVVYCTEGIRSAHMTLVLRGLGYTKARNYDGSFMEWAGDKRLTVVK